MAGRFAIETVFKAVDKISKPFSKMQQRVRRGTDKITDRLKRMNAPLTKFTKGLASASKSAILKGGSALAGGILAGAAAMTVLNNKMRTTVTLGQSIGASAALLENLETAIAPAGFELDNIVDLIEEMNNKLGESAGLKEITPVTESLGILGLKFKDLQKLKPEQQFKKIADAALQMEDAQKAAAAADILMGGEANKLIGILRQQGRTVDEIIAKQQKYNARTDEGRQGAVKFADQMGKTLNLIRSLADEIAGLVGGNLTPMLAKFTEFVRLNQKLIKTKILDFFEQVKIKGKAAWEWLNEEGRLKSIGTTIMQLGGLIATATAFLAEHGDTAAVLIAGLVALNAVLTTFTAVMAAVNVVMALNPIGLIVLGVTALVAAFAAMVAYRDEISSFLKELAPDWLVDYWMLIPNAIGDAIDMIGKGITEIKKLADIDPIGGVKSFFGFGDEEGEAAEKRAANRGQMVSPQERTARTIEESRTTNTAELLIRDETGRAEMTSKRPTPGIALTLSGSGGF